ncbi:unnamed protein product [Gongylonema pulchrum]|uniref:Secreted protein n=1 Tax=Gongylonema pulchrum TaxID=637853 RepID=A0A183DQR0_9BILA|nr:unnamed protein product [Gongylonema pulchrum]
MFHRLLQSMANMWNSMWGMDHMFHHRSPASEKNSTTENPLVKLDGDKETVDARNTTKPFGFPEPPKFCLENA